jgi:rhamnosyltransferase
MIIGVIVTYNPLINDLEDNVTSILPQVDKLVIFDNASYNNHELLKFKAYSSVELILSSVNVGLGEAYNSVIRANKNVFEYLITFDQDTKIPSNLIENLLPLFKVTNVGIVGPNFELRRKSRQEFEKVDVLIQSATIFKMKLFDDVGFFNADYFIDSIDFEFCLRARISGYCILRANNVFISHQLGDSKSFFGIKYNSHNEVRNYFIARNHVNLTINYIKYFPGFIFKKNIFFIVHFLKLVLLERKFKKIKLFLIGFYRGLYFLVLYFLY